MDRFNYLGALRHNFLPLMDADGKGGAGGTGGDPEPPAENEPEMFTREELLAEVDRRVTAALKKQQKKSDEKIKEAERLAKMNAEEKAQYELDQREKRIAEKEQELALAENKAECAKILANKGISADLVDFVVDADAETMQANIKLLEKCFKESVKAEVEKRLAADPPKGGSGFSTDGMTREQFRTLSIAEQQELYDKHPEVYRQMVQKG